MALFFNKEENIMKSFEDVKGDVIEFMENSSFYDEYLYDEEVIDYAAQRIIDEKAFYEDEPEYWDLIEAFLDEVI